jgi:hypothetical protein
MTGRTEKEGDPSLTLGMTKKGLGMTKKINEMTERGEHKGRRFLTSFGMAGGQKESGGE